jgi:Holliday junction resolvase RusA-like endonuclease
MRGNKLFEFTVIGNVNTKKNANSMDYFDRMEALFSTLPRSINLRKKISIDTKFTISSSRLRNTRVLDLDNLNKPVLDHLTKADVINDDANIFDLRTTKYPTDGEQFLHITGWEWIAYGN